MSKPFNTILIGCGQVAAGYGFDSQYAKFYRYATHAQVLAEHPDFNWIAAVDPAEKARQTVKHHYPKVAIAPALDKLPRDLPEPAVAVIATPANVRLEVLDQLPANIKAVIVEKPLGQSVAECKEFIVQAARRGIVVQVNLWRRADALHRELAAGGLKERIGELQGLQIVYDGALRNTGTHVFDCVEMLVGPMEAVAVAPNYSGLLYLQSGVVVTLLALATSPYRELTFDFWGTDGRLVIGQEALQVMAWRQKPHRAMHGSFEIAADQSGEELTTTVGTAYYDLYTNLAANLRGEAALWASGEAACRAERIIAALELSASSGGATIKV